jgi:hypothetical protein
MKDYSTIINTALGSVFSIVIINPTEVVTTLMLGVIGAVGAYMGTMFCKWLTRKIEKWLG